MSSTDECSDDNIVSEAPALELPDAPATENSQVKAWREPVIKRSDCPLLPTAGSGHRAGRSQLLKLKDPWGDLNFRGGQRPQEDLMGRVIRCESSVRIRGSCAAGQWIRASAPEIHC